MSRLNKTIMEWIVTKNKEHSLNIITKIIRRIISMEFPILFTKLYYYDSKRDRMLWNGKKGKQKIAKSLLRHFF